jgi:hypothetical protein
MTAPRTLVVVSNDYGELLLAMMFLQGQQLATNAALLLPPRLHAANGATLDVPAYQFASLDDILRVVDEWRPQVVILMSGYLFSNNKLLSRDELGRLVAHLRASGRHLLTTDPFIGMAGTLTHDDIRLGLPESGDALLLPSSDMERVLPAVRIDRQTAQESMRTAEREIADDLSEVSQILSEVTHLYGVPASALPATVHRVSFFNPELERRPPGGSGHVTPGWLFIIGSHDLWYQQLHLGVDAFPQLLTARLEEAERFGARPSVIAPPAVLEQLSARLPANTNVELTRFCSHHDYVTRLFDAEYVFYWNLFSASFMLRLTRALPSFFFDRGHLSRLIERAYPVGRRVLMQEWEPAYLALGEALDPGRLKADAAAQTRRFREIVDNWRQSPTPDELVSALTNRVR